MARVMKAAYILAAVRGVIQGVYISNEWLLATKEDFPGRADYPGRILLSMVLKDQFPNRQRTYWLSHS